MVSLEDRVFGALFGQAVGDALGLGTEFMSRTDVIRHYPDRFRRYEQIIQDEHRRRWKPGAWTDDTEQMTMILDSLLEKGAVDVCDIGRRISNWVFHARGEGVGMTVYAVLKHPAFLADPHAAARAVWEQSGQRIAANGGIMRTSVLGLWDFGDWQRIRANAEAVCRVTHFDPRCVASCVAVSLLVNALASGRAADRALFAEVRAIASTYDARVNEPFERALDPDVATLQLDAEESIGYTMKPLAAGLWALMHGENFDDGLLCVIAQGGDADSNGAVAGALLGARDGLRGVPTHLVRGLTTSRYLGRVARELLARIAPGDAGAVASAEALAFEAGGTLTEASIVAYAKRAHGGAHDPWVLFECGTVILLDPDEAAGDAIAHGVEKLERLATESGVTWQVRKLHRTEGWMVGDASGRAFTFVHPLEINRDTPSDADIADHASFKRARRSGRRRALHVEARA